MDPARQFADEVGADPAEQRLDRLVALIGAAFTGAPEVVDESIARLDVLAQRCEPTFDGVMRGLFGPGLLRGNTGAYSDPRNSFLHEVLRRGLGIPITLSVCAMEAGRRIGVVIDGIGTPGHFLVRSGPQCGDPFNGGRIFPAADLEAEWRRLLGTAQRLPIETTQPVPPRRIALRMLENLRNVLMADGDAGPLATLATLRSAFPELDHERSERDRWLRHWN